MKNASTRKKARQSTKREPKMHIDSVLEYTGLDVHDDWTVVGSTVNLVSDFALR